MPSYLPLFKHVNGSSSSLMNNGPGKNVKLSLNKATIQKQGSTVVINKALATLSVSNGLMNNGAYNRFNSKAYFLSLRP